MQSRLLPWLGELAARGEAVGAVAHKGIIRCIYALACDWDMRGDAPVEFAWDALHLFDLSGSGRPLPGYRAVPLARG